MTTQNSQNSITIVPTAAPTYSLGLHAAGVPALSSVMIQGVQGLCPHTLSFNIYGLSKSGFFMERTAVCPGELLFQEKEGTLFFSMQRLALRIRREFFLSLRKPVTGKLCVEATVDGVRYLGDAPVTLLPACVYPAGVSPSFFAASLTPFHPQVSRILSNTEGNGLSALYQALKRENMIYSVKDCDFQRHDVSFDDMERLYSGRTRMASPLEMAQLFAAAALRMGLAPVIAAVRTPKAPRLFCGVCREKGSSESGCSSGKTLRSLLSGGKAALFDVSCLFTGHNVEWEEACHRAVEELSAADFLFVLDIRQTLREGVNFFGLYPEQEKEEEAFLQALRLPVAPRRITLPALAESLTHTADTPLLHFDFQKEPGIPVAFSDFERWKSAAGAGGEWRLSGIRDIPDPRLAAVLESYGPALLEEDSFDELTQTEKQELLQYQKAYRSYLAEEEKKGVLGLLENMSECLTAAEALLAEQPDAELYLACGFIKGGKQIETAPLALFPVTLTVAGGRLSLRFTASRPYVNRLLCETLRSGGARRFFDEYGLPGHDYHEIIACFEALCRGGDYRLIRRAVLARFPYRSSVLAFDLVDKSEKLLNDKLSRQILQEQSDVSRPAEADRTYREAMRQIESRAAEPLTNDVLSVTAQVRDDDILALSCDSVSAAQAVRSVALENLRLGRTTLVVAEEASALDALRDSLAELGFSETVLTLCQQEDVRGGIREKLLSLSKANLPDVPDTDDTDYRLLRDKLAAYRDSKERRYDFDFSFTEAAEAFVRAGTGLSEEERQVFLEPDALFYPDMSKSTVAALFDAQRRLCRAAMSLCGGKPVGQHPFFHAKLKHPDPPVKTGIHLADKCRLMLEDFIPSADFLLEKTGFEASELRTLPALHAYLSLTVLLIRQYDAGVTETLLVSDVYALSQQITSLRQTAEEIRIVEQELCEFDDGLYGLDAETLFHQWAEGKEVSHSDITKTVNAFRTVDGISEHPKMPVQEVLSLLCRRKGLCTAFQEESRELSGLFAGYWNGEKTDWDKLTGLLDFAKNADVLLKKIYGTDIAARHRAAKRLPAAAAVLSDPSASSKVLNAAGLFDRMFSDEGCFAALAELLDVDVYRLSFEEGILAGFAATLENWREHMEELPLAAEYNRSASLCREKGLGCFADYLEKHPCTPHTESVFIRSQLRLAMKQMALYDKRLMAYPRYQTDLAAFEAMHRDRMEGNRASLRRRYLDGCAAYIRENSEKAAAFSEALCDGAFCTEELLLRHADTLRALFPIVLAQPSYTGFVSGFETTVIFDAGRLSPEKAISCLHTGLHKLILADSRTLERDSLADILMHRGLPYRRLRVSGGAAASAPALSCLRTPVSFFDREKMLNLPEAQTLGLELMKALEKEPSLTTALVALTRPQTGALQEVLEVLCEKSGVVAQAVSEGRVEILYAASPAVRPYDRCFVSTVYNGDNAAGTERLYSGDLEQLLSCFRQFPAKQVTCVTSLNSMAYPLPEGASGGLQMLPWVQLSQVGQNAAYDCENALQSASSYAVEFCRIMAEKGVPACLAVQGRAARFFRDGVPYLAVFEEAGEAVYDGECSLNAALKQAGERTVRLDGAALFLNPPMIWDIISGIKEGTL